jgi:hypothetical protein
MANYNSLEWQNENSLSGFPLVSEISPTSLLVDARFVQFDNFTPVLNYVFADSDKITFAITFDYGQHTTISYLKTEYQRGEAFRYLRIYQPATNRYLGTLTLGEAALDLMTSLTGSKLVYDISFDPCTVRSIPKKDGVYTFDGNYGDVVLSRPATDTAFFYNTTQLPGLNTITINAVGGHEIPTIEYEGATYPTLEGLRKLNLVSPVANNVNIVPNDVVKVTPYNAYSLTISLATGTPSSAFTIPSLAL